ncbi:hypothetical protein MMC25_005857 [Agyrium rufum]|nr:hypothetical protein [Agyrium rufum]
MSARKSQAVPQVRPQDIEELLSFEKHPARYTGRSTSSSIEIFTPTNPPDEKTVRNCIDAYYRCSATHLFIFPWSDVEAFLEDAYGSSGPPTEVSLGVLCALVAVACQCDLDILEPDVVASFYDTAKFYLDECLEQDDIIGMRVLALLTITCCMEKRVAAWMWIGSATRIANTQGLTTQDGEFSFTDATWVGQKKTWLTLVFLETWIAVTQGRIVGTERRANTTNMITYLEQYFVTHEDSIQLAMAKIGIIMSDCFRDIFLTEHISLRKILEYNERAELWLASLPEFMQLSSVSRQIREGAMTLAQYRSTLLVHLIFNGTLILIHRSVLFHLQKVDRNAAWVLDASQEEAVRCAEICVQAAMQTSQVVQLLLSEGAIFKRCWLVITQSFIAGAILLFHVAQMRLHGASRDDCDDFLDRIKTCLKALQFCSNSDRVAHDYLSMLSIYFRRLNDSGFVLVDGITT